MIARFPGRESEHPASADWAWRTYEKAKADPRVSEVLMWRQSDTPITMVRNLCVRDALSAKVDVLVMVDSDMQPDCEPDGKPFWDTTFEFWWARRHAPMVIGAPYVGPPPINNIYVFQFENYNNYDGDKCHLPQYTRSEAGLMMGISRCGALPTGVIFYGNLSGCMKLSADDPGYGLPPTKDKGWFYYEWRDEACAEKASTEDVTNTRDIGLLLSTSNIQDAGVYCNWDAWAGHVKPQVQRKPRPVTVDDVGESLRNGWASQLTANTRMVELNVDLPPVSKAKPVPRVNGVKPEIPPVKRIGNVTSEVDLSVLRDAAWKAKYDFTELSKATGNARPFRAVEVGCWVGESTRAIWEGIAPDGRLICVDHWQGSPGDTTSRWATEFGSDNLYETFRQNMAHVPDDRLTVFRMDSARASKRLADDTVDFLHIDAGHTRADLLRDLDAWLPKLVSTATLCCHDYMTGLFPDVTEVLDRAFKVRRARLFSRDRQSSNEFCVVAADWSAAHQRVVEMLVEPVPSIEVAGELSQ